MNDHKNIFDIIGLAIVGIPSIIAAWSSLRNGKKANENAEKLDHNTQLTADIKKTVNGGSH